MLNLYFCNGKAFVWNAKDALALRKEHRIVGSLVGNYPIKPFQIQTKWLPLQLMPEETKLLIDKGIAQLVSLPEELPDSKIIQLFYEQRDKLCEEQISLLKENRKQQILEKADEIFEGKKRKYLESLEKKKAQKLSEASDVSASKTSSAQNVDSENENSSNENNSSAVKCKDNMNSDSSRDSTVEEETSTSKTESQEGDSESINIDKNTIIESELAKVTGVSKEMCLIQLFTESPWKTKCAPITWNYPSSEIEKLRYAVYKDLWEKKLYITAGVKFGGDFLAYEGDPLKYHALYIIICMCRDQRFQGYDVVTYGRLGHQVKKSVALASLNDSGEIEYISFSWESEMT